MISYTPVANHIVQHPPGDAPNGSPVRRGELRAPVVVITPVGEVELGHGSLLIGRLPECDILLNDGLVSRMHARISVQDGRIVLEDLHSTNGVFVNGQKAGYAAALCEGDRVLVGTSEFSLFQRHDSTIRPVPSPLSHTNGETQLPPPSQRQTVPAINLRAARLERSSPEPLSAELTALEPSFPEPSTRRSDALQMLGGVAERLAALGKVAEAANVLSEQLKRILRGANSGLPVPPEMVTSASLYALKLARWTKQTLWADYVVELHLSTKQLMSIATLQAYEVAIAHVGFDRLLLAYYVESLTNQLPGMKPAESSRVTHLQSILQEDG